jgi:hypothetical protein
MTEEVDFETYLSVTKNKFQIFLFDKKNFKNIYKNELEFKNKFNFIEFNNLSKFLDNNIFKIEKLSGSFIKNIFLIIEHDENLYVDICVKKKNYDDLINQKDLKNILSEVKDLFKENYQEQNILHMIVNNYLINGQKYSTFTSGLKGDHLCLEVNFVSISNDVMISFDKVLENYQIKVSKYFSEHYVKNFFNEDNMELSKMAHKLKNGYNHNEVILIPKNIENKGFFEKFFQLFS